MPATIVLSFFLTHIKPYALQSPPSPDSFDNPCLPPTSLTRQNMATSSSVQQPLYLQRILKNPKSGNIEKLQLEERKGPGVPSNYRTIHRDELTDECRRKVMGLALASDLCRTDLTVNRVVGKKEKRSVNGTGFYWSHQQQRWY